MARPSSSPPAACPPESFPAAGEGTPLHISVLLKEVTALAPVFEGAFYLDATLGLGGHSEALLLQAAPGTELLGLDRDTEALSRAEERLAPFGSAVHTAHRPFSEAADAVAELGKTGIDFALADIGVSSMQLDFAERGFSFHADGPLDMRMDQSKGRPASFLVNKAPVAKLKDIIAEYGEDPMAGRIARAIDDARNQHPIESTRELARIVEAAYPAKWRAASRNHPATRTFQALRMAVNGELEELETFLKTVTPLLNPGGRIAVISFHSLEDRIVKHFFRDAETGCRCPRQVPVCICGQKPVLKVLTKKPVLPSAEECAANPRSSCAKMRAAEKLPQ